MNIYSVENRTQMYQPLIHAPNFECQLSPEAVAELIPSKKISLPKAANQPIVAPQYQCSWGLVGTLILFRMLSSVMSSHARSVTGGVAAPSN